MSKNARKAGNKAGNKGGGSKKSGKSTLKQPKSTCCVSKSKCTRCPLRMLKEGTLPAGYTVKKRRLVKAA